jgi:hypothetical protein
VEETSAAPVEDGAPAATDEAASAVTETTGAPATTQPEGYIEQKRYDDLRAEFDRKNTLLDRALRGDAQAAQELGFEFADDQQDPDPGTRSRTTGRPRRPTPSPASGSSSRRPKRTSRCSTHISTASPAVRTSWTTGTGRPF